MPDHLPLPTHWRDWSGETPAAGEVHVFRIRTERETSLNFLSFAEIERAGRFRRPDDRARFVTARHALRRILARLTGIKPAALNLVADERGKPFLADRPSLHFNLSHSGDWVAIAIACDNPVGIDVEVHRPLVHAAAIAARMFTTEESRRIASLSSPAREACFYRAWTMMEARSKMLGVGLFASEPPGLRDKLDSCFAIGLTIADGYSAAVATTVPAVSIACWQLGAADPDGDQTI